jgi:NADPH:quinone reductase-like Zn-dependent oxidoreductase
MKAIVYYDYGSPEILRLEEIERPTPGDDEVLLKVRAAAVNPLDWRLLKGAPYVLRALFRLPKPSRTRPGRPGRDVAGVVESVGKNVTQFNAGDEVFGWCQGAFAEYACTPESSLAAKPANVTFDQAASVPVAALTALQGLRDKGRIRAGQKVLINGAAGGVGTFAVQIAKSFGAEVTGVCSTRNLEMVRSIGADRAIDYTREDFTRGGQRYDLMLDNVGNHSLSACRRVMNRHGVCVMAGAPKNPAFFLTRALTAPVLSRLVSQRFGLFIAKLKQEDLATMRDLMEAGKVTPVIDRRYGLSEAPDAIRYLEEGHARGKVVITV